MEKQIETELLVACNNLGYLNENHVYVKDPDCIHCLKECLRFLRRDNKRFTVRRELGFTNIVTTDLIPIMKQHCIDDEFLFDIVLRLLVNLTNPALLLFREQVPDTPEEQQLYTELCSYLYNYKVAFSTDVKLFSVLAKHSGRILQLGWEKRQEEHRIMLERILILIRNILHVPVDIALEKGTDEDANVQDLCIETMQLSGINDLILLIASSESEREFSFHVLEILSLMMREQSAEFLAKSIVNSSADGIHMRSFFEKQKDSENLKELLKKDRCVMKLKNATNFNRFKEATYVVKNLKSLSDKDVVYHKTPSDINTITFDNRKRKLRKPKNRALFKEDKVISSNKEITIHQSTFKVRKYLREICSAFVTECYNDIMKVVRDNLERKRSQENDETYYLWASQFFMEFNRCSKMSFDNILATISVESFHYLHTLIEYFQDHVEQEKKKFHPWSKRMHYALKAYRELLFTLASFDCSPKSYFRDLARTIKSKLFYEIDYRELLLGLISHFNAVKMPLSYLKDLVETNHIFLKMLEQYFRVNEKVIVKQKQRKQNHTKKKTVPTEASELVWAEITTKISEALSGALPLPTAEENPLVIPIDNLSELSPDEQKLKVMTRIHTLLKNKQCTEAVALYRNSREAWIDDMDNAFGAAGISLEEELMNLQEILFDNFLAEKAISSQKEKNDSEMDKEDEMLQERKETSERELIFSDFVKKYITPRVLMPYILLLQSFDTNSYLTNHSIIKMFHRIAIDNKMHAMFFQLSLFRIFQKVLNFPFHEADDIKEIARFATHILHKFLAITKRNKLAFVELIFWKNGKIAYEMEEGYGSFETIKKTKNEDEDENLKLLKAKMVLNENYSDSDENESENENAELKDDENDNDKCETKLYETIEKDDESELCKELEQNDPKSELINKDKSENQSNDEKDEDNGDDFIMQIIRRKKGKMLASDSEEEMNDFSIGLENKSDLKSDFDDVNETGRQ
ncbi:protein timeless-like protein [Dinothrombium tinctorium]|uniref:Protein timeless-like protein n=1 Tax=Dinothrombium tinctorium TaxID=1965070 RepID=A0A443RPC0_9ACAR|nr:protein timeless-like protein [Dinothrombium tinctorium]